MRSSSHGTLLLEPSWAILHKNIITLEKEDTKVSHSLPQAWQKSRKWKHRRFGDAPGAAKSEATWSAYEALISTAFPKSSIWRA